MDSLPEDTQRKIVDSVARMRIAGLALGLLPVLVVFHELSAPLLMWVLAVANGLLWPWLARRRAAAATDPLAAERTNLLVDSAMGGVWVALMQFTLVPSVVLASMLLMDKFAFGGPRLAGRCLSAFILAGAVIAALNGFAFRPESSTWATLATLPLLVVYPTAIAAAAHRLSRRVMRQSKRLRELCRIDDLTGLANRRALLEAAEHEFRRFRRSGHRATFMMIDVDRFKRLNDHLGHAAGDEALRSIARVLRDTLRDTDTCGRLGGDEFGVVLADASGAGVGDLAERLREAVARRHPASGSDGLTTISIGHAELDARMEDVASWIAAADRALYAAKSAGRNRSMAAPLYGAAP